MLRLLRLAPQRLARAQHHIAHHHDGGAAQAACLHRLRQAAQRGHALALAGPGGALDHGGGRIGGQCAQQPGLYFGGMARAHLLRACDALSIPTDETAFTLSELFAADEVIVTSSSNLCIRADRIDGKAVGGKAPELFERLRRYLLDEYMTETA